MINAHHAVIVGIPRILQRTLRTPVPYSQGQLACKVAARYEGFRLRGTSTAQPQGPEPVLRVACCVLHGGNYYKCTKGSILDASTWRHRHPRISLVMMENVQRSERAWRTLQIAAELWSVCDCVRGRQQGRWKWLPACSALFQLFQLFQAKESRRLRSGGRQW